MITDKDFLKEQDTTNNTAIIGKESADLLEELYQGK